ncbi:MAG TPA: O-antigen ligase family protein [bacterium]|nr:O-antigen ligase family protein [bacterium]
MSKNLLTRDRLWWLFWFWAGLRSALVVFMQDDSVLFAAVDTLTTVFLGMTIILASGRLFPFRLRGISLVILLLNGVNVVSVFTSSVYFESPLRIYTYLVNTLAWSLPALAYADTQDARAGLGKMGRAFALGTVLLVLAPLAVEGLSGLSTRYGIDELLDPNTIGFHTAVAFVFILAWIRTGLSGTLDWLLALFFAVALLLTFSKTALVGATAAVLLLWTLAGLREKPAQLGAQLIAITIPLLLLWGRVTNETAAYLEDPYGDPATLSGRIPLWQIVMSLSTEHPWLGFGYGTFREVIRPYSGIWGIEIVHAHNAYLTALLQTGVVGAALTLLLAVVVLGQAVRLVRHRRSDAARLWIALAALVLIRSLTEGTFGAGGFEFGLLAALGVLGERIAAEEDDRLPSTAAAGAPQQRLAEAL